MRIIVLLSVMRKEKLFSLELQSDGQTYTTVISSSYWLQWHIALRSYLNKHWPFYSITRAHLPYSVEVLLGKSSQQTVFSHFGCLPLNFFIVVAVDLQLPNDLQLKIATPLLIIVTELCSQSQLFWLNILINNTPVPQIQIKFGKLENNGSRIYIGNFLH